MLLEMPDRTADILVIIPVYNDWSCAVKLIQQIFAEFEEESVCAKVLLVDDASTIPPEGLELTEDFCERVTILTLRRNLGHQRAIAIGLTYAQQNLTGDAVIVMDGDGEDRPSDAARLYEQYLKHGDRQVVFAERTRRSEVIRFVILYHLFRAVHFLLTGFDIRVGNFSLIPWRILDQLVVVSEIWNHYPAAVKAARLPVTTIPTARGKRIDGHSQMNLTGLVIHGLSAISVYGETIGTRMLFGSVILIGTLVAAIAAVMMVRLSTDLAVPGWATYSTGLLVILLFQAVLSSMVFVFFTLSGRTGAGFIPIRDYAYFVRGYDTVESHERLCLCRG